MALLLPAIARSKMKAKRVQCIGNLKQHGLVFHTFAHDHESRFPMEVSTNNGGSLEFMRLATNMGGEIYFSFRHYQAVGKDLESPKLLLCPTDTRLPAESFSKLRNENLSYFISGSALYDNPMSILSGDRNIETYDFGLRSVLRLDANDLPGWSAEMHQHKGNLLFADAHVEQVDNKGLRAALQSTPGGRVVLLPPVSSPQTVVASANASGTGQGNATSASATETGPTAGKNAPASPAGAAETPQGSATRSTRAAKGSSPGVSASGALNTDASASPRDSGPKGQGQSSAGVEPGSADPDYQPDSWPAMIGHYVTTTGARLTWLLLLVILSVLVYFEIRRRRAKAVKEPEEISEP